MALRLGDRVRVTRGDMRGRIGTVDRVGPTSIAGGQTYGIAFPGEEPLSNFRVSNLQTAGTQAAVPEFLEMNGAVYRLIGDEPYTLITGGLMGKRRRYWIAAAEVPPGLTTAELGAKECDFRRFPIERYGVVVGGLWSRFQPRSEQVTHILSLIASPSDS